MSVTGVVWCVLPTASDASADSAIYIFTIASARAMLTHASEDELTFRRDEAVHARDENELGGDQSKSRIKACEIYRRGCRATVWRAWENRRQTQGGEDITSTVDGIMRDEWAGE